MAFGFPVQLVSKLCCIHDGAELKLGQNCQLSEDKAAIKQGSLQCSKCQAAFEINDGIVNVLSHISLDDESKHEVKLRNEIVVKHKQVTGISTYQKENDAMEMDPMVEALSLTREETILELGCGDGRFTARIVNESQFILAVDFSIESLRLLQSRLSESRNIGLVLGDVTTMKVTPASFDRALCTLVSNLPTRDHRNAMYRLAATALKPNGRFVFSSHHQGIRESLRGEKKSERYWDGGIYRYNFSVSECKTEVQPYFAAVKAWPIQIYLPFSRSLRLPLVALSRFCEHVPGVNKLGGLILAMAEKPLD